MRTKVQNNNIHLSRTLTVSKVISKGIHQRSITIHINRNRLTRIILLNTTSRRIPNISHIMSPRLTKNIKVHLSIHHMRQAKNSKIITILRHITNPINRPFLKQNNNLLTKLLTIILSLIKSHLNRITLLHRIGIPPTLTHEPQLPQNIRILRKHTRYNTTLIKYNRLLHRHLLNTIGTAPIRNHNTIRILNLQPITKRNSHIQDILNITQLTQRLHDLHTRTRIVNQ